MAIILIHSSKTMRADFAITSESQTPVLLDKATTLAAYVANLSPKQLEKPMHLSPILAVKTHKVMNNWQADKAPQLLAIDAFLGDIYSGLRAAELTPEQRDYANDHLYILSGLYGVLKPLDGIMPYRLEMGYRFNDEPFTNLYSFWGCEIANALPVDKLIVNLSALEYTKAVIPYLENRTVISPRFLTRDPKTREPKFVVVHAKIARGAFARWMICNKIERAVQLTTFTDLNYTFDSSLSTATEPMFVCETFGGLGLSVRLAK